ncbi:uncharacterized protein K444DRAFT_622743 [Hyaloscypha bicolor E]|uniref:Uncharacterized protein n=1 Tax=Hyaloscypha bicolor E TaxID=1095630 RepID=A0A2J6SEJ9_9HELO|nr:uncharacterized protein K444DRAFT_622743 [Hyaloscypha bicolor E]PMD49183.1 hypothetical protein K444DRAFT_622743 [Hyaloscypha bicolor E]
MASAQQDNSKASADAAPVENGQDLASSPGEDKWDEERLEKAMNTLKEMHIQLRGLRTAVPRLIAPLTTKQPSPETLYHEFRRSTSTANQELQQFWKLMNDEESLKVLEQARKSRAENPNGIKPWKVTEHPDWATRGT